MARKKRIIWSNINLNLEDWEEYLKEEFEDLREKWDEHNAYLRAHEINNMYLDDERLNLDIPIKVIAIASLGFWHGRKQGYKIYNNLADILYSSCDYAEWYFDGYNLKGVMHHHDGTNYVLYRVIKDDVDIDRLCDMIYEDKKISNSTLNRYTRSLKKELKEKYGW